MSCLLCNEIESNQHLFFECVVAVRMWKTISQVINREVGNSFESFGTCWLSNKKFLATNIILSASLWTVETEK